ncbi:MAG TPA: HNH endonuclease [Gemmatimonadales bacterium]|nr:HNH endonuclease [Gemmatimonadales bacterium]
MASVGRRKRLRAKYGMWERGAAAWEHLTGQAGGYFCPICQGGYRRGAVDAGLLTVDHVPPASLGGKELVLTCKECNNTAGHTVDAAVRAREDLFALGRALFQREGTVSGRGAITIGDTRLNIDFAIGPDGPTFVVPREINDPAKIEAQEAYLRDSSAGKVPSPRSLTFSTGIRFRSLHAKVGDLRTAYLAAFAKYGYWYALHPHLDAVRRQIRNPDTAILPDSAWSLIMQPSEHRPPLLLGLHTPTEALSVYVGRVLVHLPWLNEVEDPYPLIAAARKRDGATTFSGEVLDWPTVMSMSIDFQLPKGAGRATDTDA